MKKHDQGCGILSTPPTPVKRSHLSLEFGSARTARIRAFLRIRNLGFASSQQRDSKCDLIFDPFEFCLTNARDSNEILKALEVAVGFAVLHDPLGQHRPYAFDTIKLTCVCPVDVDFLYLNRRFGRRSCKNALHLPQERTAQETTGQDYKKPSVATFHSNHPLSLIPFKRRL